MDYLNAVFWDYPRFTDGKCLKKYIKQNKCNDGYKWVLGRFLEHGRVVDTFKYFSISEIADLLPLLKLSDYSLKKWKRMIQVYNEIKRK